MVLTACNKSLTVLDPLYINPSLDHVHTDTLNLVRIVEESIFMANIKSAKKRIIQTEWRTEVNRSRRSDMRTYVKRVEMAIEAGDSETAKSAFSETEHRLMRCAQKGLLHRNTAARKLSRLSKQIKGLNA